MFVVTIYNCETEEEFIEKAQNQKELDELVESMHNVYGDILQIDIREDEDEIQTKRYSDRPVCPECLGQEQSQECKTCGHKNSSVEVPLHVWLLT